MKADRSDDGHVIILAGGTGRVGGTTLATLVARGARVAVFSRDAGRARATIERELASNARERAHVVVADLTNAADTAQAVGGVLDRFGRLDAAISLAGGGSARVSIAESTGSMLAETVRNNLEVAYNLVVPALRAMLRQAPRAGARSRGRHVAVTAGSSRHPPPMRRPMSSGVAMREAPEKEGCASTGT